MKKLTNPAIKAGHVVLFKIFVLSFTFVFLPDEHCSGGETKVTKPAHPTMAFALAGGIQGLRFFSCFFHPRNCH
ncbi:MAG: hypothetical protein K8R53_04050 [Bacteroidales bacterium]|nr:hypothetical protein [Bacteroidales bacterium]